MKALQLLLFSLCFLPSLSRAEKLNVILIFTDDQGYNDLSCFGSETIHTPHIDELAAEGRKFTSFYVASPVCTPSRAALLTACYPKRVGMAKSVLFPQSKHGLHPDEYTLGDHFHQNGYATACIGKWHLGHQPEVLPRAQGFDSYYGIPYSNDMNHPDNKGFAKGGIDGLDLLWEEAESTLTKWKTPLIENEEIVELPVDQRTITRRYTDRAVDFITENKEKPFFLYLPHSMPHIPLYVPEGSEDKDPKRAYINVIEHIDAQVGRISKTVRDLGLSQNTLIIFTSDNGPWLRFKHHAGSALPLRNGKGTNYEGGQRVPCVMWSPGRIPANTTCPDMLSTMDLLPTLAAITRTSLPQDFKSDGFNAARTVLGDTPSPREEFVYYTKNGRLAGIRIKEWKLLTFLAEEKDSTVPLLFNLKDDLSEKKNLASQHPEIVARLKQRMTEIDAEITANARPVFKFD